MAGNSNFRASGVSYASNEKQMDAYDRLPPSVRAALANAAFDWAAFPLRRRFERGQYTVAELVKKIDNWDRDQIAKDRPRVWGLPTEARRRRAVSK